MPTDPTEALPCIVCSQTLMNVNRHVTNQPHGGTTFYSHGHFGSTVFDPFDGTYLEVNLCDRCLELGAERGHVLLNKDIKKVNTDSALWRGPSGDTP